MQAILLVSILLITLIYLHVKGSHLIFQRDVKIAKVLSLIVLVLAAGASFLGIAMSKSDILGFIFLYYGVIWVLLVIAYWKLFSGCYNDAWFKRHETVDSALREKARDILLEVVSKKQFTPEWKNFLKVNSNDPLIEKIRGRCKGIYTGYADNPFREDGIEMLKNFAKQLAN